MWSFDKSVVTLGFQWKKISQLQFYINLTKLASFAKWLNVLLWTKWLWVRVQLQSLKLQILRLLRARSPLTFSNYECGSTLKRVRDMIRTYSRKRLCWNLFLNKVAGLRPNIAKFMNSFFIEYLRWLLTEFVL